MATPEEVAGKFRALKQHWHRDTRTAREQADIGADMSVAVMAAFSRHWADRSRESDPQAPASDR